jgi:hypothetical protein
MRTSTFRTALALAALATLFTAPAAFAQATFTGTYTQNFSSMGTGTSVPAGWSGVSEAGSHFTFSPNVANEYDDGDAPVNPNFTAGALTSAAVEFLTPTQGSSTGKGSDIVNYSNTLATGQNGEGSESLGTDPSGNAATILELSLTNTTGSAISAVNLSYDIDRFTTVSDTNGNPSGYANSSVEELPGYELFYNLTPSNPATWVNVSSLNPTVNMGTVAGAVNVPDTVGITVVPTTTVTLDSAWASGSTIAFAWFDDNASASSPDQEIGLNNVVIAATPEPNSAALGLIAVGGAVLMLRLRRRSVA